MTKNRQLEIELNRKTSELNDCMDTQYLLQESLKNNTKRLGEIENMLKLITVNLKHSNERFNELKKENQGLKLSCDMWMRRAIKLEFDVLSARDADNK